MSQIITLDVTHVGTPEEVRYLYSLDEGRNMVVKSMCELEPGVQAGVGRVVQKASEAPVAATARRRRRRSPQSCNWMLCTTAASSQLVVRIG